MPAWIALSAARADVLLERFKDEDGDGVTNDFRVGVLFTVALLADPTFDY
ncbi:hypothetical protein OG203_38105 [Nocardia sp. NBC_01499]